MKILIIVAGTNDPSNSAYLAQEFAKGIAKVEGAQTHTEHLRLLEIFHFNVDFYEETCNQEEDFCMLQKHMEESAGVVIASPIWNFGTPAHLKNFFDRMGSFALDKTRTKGTLSGKPFFLIFTGGGPKAAWPLFKQSTSSIPLALQFFGGSLLGTHFEGKCTKGKGEFGLVVDQRPDTLERMRTLGEEFGRDCKDYQETGVLPLKYRIRRWIVETAQKLAR